MSSYLSVTRDDGISFSEDILAKARTLGIVGSGLKDEATELKEVLWYSVRVTHPRANLRHEDFFFQVKDHKLVDLFIINCQTCDDTKKITAFDECPYCEGSGCDHCGGRGDIASKIPCPSCSKL